MGKPNVRLDAARRAYREALEAARRSPTPDAWAKLLTAGKELSAAEDPRSRGRRRRRPLPPPPESVESTAESVESTAESTVEPAAESSVESIERERLE